ncbi:MAG: lamin tail domain-containing protein [Chitinophagaceae bacterium]
MRQLYMLLMVCLLPVLTRGQITWNFGTTAPGLASPSSGGTVANISTISDLSRGNSNSTTLDLLTTTSASSGYTGVSGSYNAGAAARVGVLSMATNGSAYFEFTLTPATGYSIKITEIDFGTRSTSTGPVSYDIRTSLDSYGTAIATGTIANNSTWVLKTNALTFSGTEGTPITVRIYGYGGSGSASANTANWRIDDLAVTATATGSASPTPNIAVSPGSITHFTTKAGTPSAADSSIINGGNLAADITVSVAGGPYEIALTEAGPYSSSLTFTQSAGAVTNKAVYVRISSSATPATSVPGVLNLVSDITTQTITLNGTVTSAIAPDAPASLSATAVSTSEIDLSATANGTGTDIIVAFNTSATFGTPSGTLSTGNSISGGGTVLYKGPASGFTSFQHTGRNAATTYYYSVWSVDAFNTYSTAVTANATTSTPPAANVVINQVYGGGGNASSYYKNDFIELYNNENNPVNLAGWSVQYTSAAGTGTWTVQTLTGTIPAKGFFLIQGAAGTTQGGGTAPLPTPDITGTLSMGATSGKVILCNVTTAQTGANPSGTVVIDKVGYGNGSNGATAATGFETLPTNDLSNSTSAQRVTAGVDNNNNFTDFVVGSPVPRNSSYTVTAPVIQSLNPPTGTTGVPYNIVPSLVFSKPVVKGTGSVTIYENGVAGTPIDITSSSVVISNGVNVTINTTLTGGKSYYIEITSGALEDVYGNDFTGITNSTTWAFTTYNPATLTSIPVTFDLQACTGNGLLPDGFTQYNSLGGAIWDCTVYGRDPAAPKGTDPYANGIQINGYDNTLGNVTNVDWLISPALDLTGTTYPLLAFYSRTKYNGAPLQLKISTDYTGTGDPSLATWTDLNGRFPNQTTDTWTLSSNINLSNFKQSNVHIAFVYTSTNDDGARWTLDDISLINSATPPPPTLTVSTGDINFPYTAANSSSTKQFTLIGNDLAGGGGINLTTTGNFQVSKDNSSFGSSVNLTEAEANNVTKTVYVKFVPDVADKNYTGTVTVSTAGTSDTTLSLVGTSIDPAKTLEVVNWNMEWFGSSDPTLGPSNKAQQKLNARTILPALGADLYALVEVVDTSALGDIVRNYMPGYEYRICNYGSHANPYESGHAQMGDIQKEAFVYKSSVFSNVDTATILAQGGVNKAADLGTVNYNNWSSGRYPFMMTADVTLNGVVQKIRFIAVHAKANTSPTLTAYNRRKAGADSLYRFIFDSLPAGEKVVILGDFNDDLDVTITDGITPNTTSYSAFTNDPTNFYSPTLNALSLTGKKSTVSYNDVIDHVMVTTPMKAFYMNNSTVVLNDVTSLVTNYASTMSDHYPIFTRYAFDASILPITLTDFTAVKQNSTVKVSWKSSEEINSDAYVVERSHDGITFTSIGTVAAKGVPADYSLIDKSPLTGNNFYRLKMVDKDGAFKYSKVVKVNFALQLAIHINPNPATTRVNISVENTKDPVTIQVIDVNGRLVKQVAKTQNLQNIQVSVQGLTKGFYTVKVISSTEVVTQKLLVQ